MVREDVGPKKRRDCREGKEGRGFGANTSILPDLIAIEAQGTTGKVGELQGEVGSEQGNSVRAAVEEHKAQSTMGAGLEVTSGLKVGEQSAVSAEKSGSGARGSSNSNLHEQCAIEVDIGGIEFQIRN